MERGNYQYFQREHEAKILHLSVPFEERAIVHRDDTGMVQAVHRGLSLSTGKRRADLDRVVPRSLVNAVVMIMEIIKNIRHKRSIAGPDFVNDEITLRKCVQFVFRREIAGNRLRIPWLPTTPGYQQHNGD